jgi:hypothetical protein
VFTGDSLRYGLASLDSLDRDGWGLGPSLLGHPTLVNVFKVGFVVTTMFELLAPLCLVLPRFRRVWIVVVVSFHLVNWFTLNLLFWEDALLVLLLVTDIDGHVGRIGSALQRLRRSHREAPALRAQP